MLNWKLNTGRQLPIGLDIGHSSIKMMQLAPNGGHMGVLAAKKVCIDPGLGHDGKQRNDFIVAAIKDIVENCGFKGSNVISCLPNERLRITSLRLGHNETDHIQKALEQEAGQRFGMDPSKDSIRYMLAGDVPQGDEIKNELIMFAVDNQSIGEHVELLEEAGLRPVGLDAIPCALFRSFERLLQREEDREQTVVLTDVGSRFTTVVFGRGREISFIKQIQIGGDNFNREIAAKLGVGISEAEKLRGKLRSESRTTDVSQSRTRHNEDTLNENDMSENKAEPSEPMLDTATRQVMVDAISSIAEQLAKEISLCFRYYTVTFRGKRVERAVFSGGEAYEKILLSVLRRQLAVEIEVAQPLRGFDLSNADFDTDRRGLLCEWAVAAGLCLKGLNGVSRVQKAALAAG